ncbi:hypothetical protein GO730_00220 [Spirosoma sp. HMF3257]|uniref:Uncharacterized protein n=1 Tax=Spirosoma telluris TaxID=2183553 RepID=A0A327ND84_9BACT|nr:hypothetical protein [Spirosoma telluris]RAI73230.1 hypothetical protein HMF3257_00210 [Spirosoma telluris]
MESILEIFQIVKKDFCGLLNYKLRGNTIEIITGIPTITSAAVSVFISYDKGKYAVSDGGWLSAGEYNNYNNDPDEGEVIDRIIDQYMQFFSIKQLNVKMDQFTITARRKMSSYFLGAF